MDKRQKKILNQMAPTFGFIITLFITEVFNWMPATKIVWSVLVSLIIYIVMVTDLRERSKNIISIKKLDFYTAILSFLFITIFISGFLDWYRILPQFQRLTIIILLLLIYFIVLFKAMRIYMKYLGMVKHKGK